MNRMIMETRAMTRPTQNVKNVLARFSLGLLAIAALIPNMPVNRLRIHDGEAALCAAPVRSGAPFITEYEHSVQLSPVIDEYRIVQGRIWSWEERVQSHNAGLPFDAPKRGRFVMSPPWMIVRGGEIGMERIAYRIGSTEFGKNRWRLPPFDEIAAYEILPTRRVFIEASVVWLRDAEYAGFSRSR